MISAHALASAIGPELSVATLIMRLDHDGRWDTEGRGKEGEKSGDEPHEAGGLRTTAGGMTIQPVTLLRLQQWRSSAAQTN